MNTFDDGFRAGLEASARILDFMATGHAVKAAGDYVWIDKKTLRVAAEVIRLDPALKAEGDSHPTQADR